MTGCGGCVSVSAVDGSCGEGNEKPLRITIIRIPLLTRSLTRSVSSHLLLPAKAGLPPHNLVQIPHRALAILVGAELCCPRAGV